MHNSDPEFWATVGRELTAAINKSAARLEARIGQLEREITRLEATLEQRNFSYQGVWKQGRVYGAGQFVTDRGSLWHCNQFHTTTRPGDGNAAYTLAVKSGRDGRDARVA